MIKKPFVVLCGIALAARASDYQPVYSYNEILIVNNSNELIRDVTISVTGTGRKFSCANIAPLGICSNKFPRRPYEYSPIQVGWTFGNETHQTDKFVVDVPPTFYTGLVLRGVIDISPEGAVSAFFQQENPIR